MKLLYDLKNLLISFLKNIFTAFNDYKDNSLLRFFTNITTYLSILIWLLPYIVKIFEPSIQKIIISFTDIYGIIILSILIMLNNLIIFNVQNKSLIKNMQNESTYLKEVIRNYLQLLSNFYSWESGYRLTLFIPKEMDRNEFLYPVDRISYGSEPGIKNKLLKFTKNQGMPGKAWEKAWNCETYEGFIDAYQLAHIPSNIIKSKNKLVKYFNEKFNIDEKLFSLLSDRKYKIRNYFSIGIVGNHNRLVAVLIIDSTDESAFTDFYLLKKLNTGIIEHHSLDYKEAHLKKKVTDKSKPVKNTQNLQECRDNNAVELQKDQELMKLLDNIDDPNIDQDKKFEILRAIQFRMSGFQTTMPMDRMVTLFSLVLKRIKDILNSRPSFGEFYE